MKAFILLILSATMSFPFFGGGRIIKADIGQQKEPSSRIESRYAKGKELMALVETEEEARQIAEIYTIEFVSFSNGVATYHTEEAPGKVVERGKEYDWPELYVNYTRKAF